MQISNIIVHAGFPTLLTSEEFASIAKQSKGNGDVFRQQLREALHRNMNTPPMRELRFTLCYYALPYAYTRPGSNGINTTNLVKGNTIMGKPNNKPQNRNVKAEKVTLTLDSVKDAIRQHEHAVADEQLEDAAYAVLTRITKRHMSLEAALDDVLVVRDEQGFVEVDIELGSLDESTRENVVHQVIALRKARPELSSDEALHVVLTSAIETAVNSSEEVNTMKTSDLTTNPDTIDSNTLNLTPVEPTNTVENNDPVPAQAELSLDEQRALEEAYVAEHGGELKASIESGAGINWKLVGGIVGGLALLGAAGYVGYRYYQRQQGNPITLTANDVEEI